MAILSERILYVISQFKSVPNISDVQVEDPSDLIKAQINNEPSVVFILTAHTYVSVTPAIIKVVCPISLIMTPDLSINIPENMIINLAHNIVLKPMDNYIQDHSYNDNLTDTAFTIYIDPEPKNLDPSFMFRPIILRGVDLRPYQGGSTYDNLINLIKQQPHVIDVVGNIVLDPKLKLNEYENFLTFYIKTNIPLKNSLAPSDKPSVHTTTISCMITVNINEINFPDIVVRQINELLDEYKQLL